MASIAFPQNAKLLTLSTSRLYSYVFIPASTSRPTILFLHGFPSSCYDWRHQITYFSSQGYGVLAPDLLGYGNTSKPSSAEEYTCKKMAAEIIELLDNESLSTVHAVAHDTGCMLLSRLADHFPDRLLTSVFLTVPYSKPGQRFDLDYVIQMTKQALGFERFGYLSFFVTDRAGAILDEHDDSFFSLFYPSNPDLWIDHVDPTGAMEAWLQSDRMGPPASYITDEERTTHKNIMKGSHGSALNWYRALVWNLNEKDEQELLATSDSDSTLQMPVLMIRPQPSLAEIPGKDEIMKTISKQAVVKRVSARGHWIQLEAPEELHSILEEFFEQASTF